MKCERADCEKQAEVLHFQAWDQTEHNLCVEHSVDYEIGLMDWPEEDMAELRQYLTARYERSSDKEFR